MSVASVTRISPPTSVHASPGRDADFVGFLPPIVLRKRPRHAEVLRHLVGRVIASLKLLPSATTLARDLPAESTRFSRSRVPHARLAGV